MRIFTTVIAVIAALAATAIADDVSLPTPQHRTRTSLSLFLCFDPDSPECHAYPI